MHPLITPSIKHICQYLNEFNQFLEVRMNGEDALARLPVAALVHVEAEQQVVRLKQEETTYKVG